MTTTQPRQVEAPPIYSELLGEQDTETRQAVEGSATMSDPPAEDQPANDETAADPDGAVRGRSET